MQLGARLWDAFKDQFRYRDPIKHHQPWDLMIRGVYDVVRFVRRKKIVPQHRDPEA